MALAKILWVDDEIETLQSQKIFLENKGYEVSTLTNGFDAIDFVKVNPVDVVLLDDRLIVFDYSKRRISNCAIQPE
jgi:DNA-binding response OmpR family regulator